jgi:glycosyltransferase involved in cell wall biosynthesis
MNHSKTIRILGIRGVPAQHGGFETFADYFSRYLVAKGWNVVVYCQEEGSGDTYESDWEGVRRVHIPVKQTGSKGSIVFDGLAALHASREPGLVLTLGYNTAFYNLLYRFKGITNLMNMDGIEWKRSKWSKPVQWWFRINEWIACHTANHLIADHPEMKRHLLRTASADKITVSAYGAESVVNADEALLAPFGLESRRFATLIARPEPENSILESVQAFSSQRRGIKLVVLGNYSPTDPYHQAVKAAASSEVVFVGAIYDKEVVSALRFHSLFYMHGHTVGGTNPSLLEALGAGNPVVAHDNRFNRWVAGQGARYFRTTAGCDSVISRLLSESGQAELHAMAAASRDRHAKAFQWQHILAEQEKILLAAMEPKSMKGRAFSAPEKKTASLHNSIADTGVQHNV